MSTLHVTNIGDGSDTVDTEYVINGSAKAWINYNATGTVATRDSLNISSLTDNGTGDQTVDYTNAFAAADYCSNATNNGASDAYFMGLHTDSPTTALARLATFRPGVGASDYAFSHASMTGTLA